MKQNITLSLDKPLLRRARVTAARGGLSVSALALLETPARLGNARIRRREALHDRKGLRR